MQSHPQIQVTLVKVTAMLVRSLFNTNFLNIMCTKDTHSSPWNSLVMLHIQEAILKPHRLHTPGKVSGFICFKITWKKFHYVNQQLEILREKLLYIGYRSILHCTKKQTWPQWFFLKVVTLFPGNYRPGWFENNYIVIQTCAQNYSIFSQ